MGSKLPRTALSGLRALSRRPACSPAIVDCALRQSFSVTCARREEGRKWSTPLAKNLTDAINITGPVPLASFMRMCLTADVGGYYTGAIEEGRDQFGRRGDFITSPEISQVFGELIGIWFVAEWMSQGQPKEGVELIEVGPGRGTLMDDILRTVRNFKAMSGSISAVYLVETSKELREQQKTLLCGADAPMRESEAGWQSNCKYSGIPIVWTETIRGVPQETGKMPFIVAHEFFDALPIHAFQVAEIPPAPQSKPPSASSSQQSGDDSAKSASPRGTKTSSLAHTLEWREMVVSPALEGTTHADLGTPLSEQQQGVPVPEFQMTLSQGPTHHSRYLPESSPRYRALKSTPHSLIEVCPDASLYASDFATRIGGRASSGRAGAGATKPPGGAALILDYGPTDTIPVNSLRGIRQHRRVSPFQEPGLVDLSVDVDFAGIAESALQASPGIEVHGPVDQAYFLESMGIRQRADMLIKKLKQQQQPQQSPGGAVAALEQKAAEIDKACKRLVDRGPGGMGKLYKALAILPENGGKRRPVGFGGDVA